MSILDRLYPNGLAEVTHEGFDKSNVLSLGEEDRNLILEVQEEADLDIILNRLEEDFKQTEVASVNLEKALVLLEELTTNNLALNTIVNSDASWEQKTALLTPVYLDLDVPLSELTHEGVKDVIEKVKKAIVYMADKIAVELKRFFVTRYSYQKRFSNSVKAFIEDIKFVEVVGGKWVKEPTYSFSSSGNSYGKQSEFVKLSSGMDLVDVLYTDFSPEVWDEDFANAIKELAELDDENKITEFVGKTILEITDAKGWVRTGDTVSYFFGDMTISFEFVPKGKSPIKVDVKSMSPIKLVDKTADVTFEHVTSTLQALVNLAESNYMRQSKLSRYQQLPVLLKNITYKDDDKLIAQKTTAIRSLMSAHANIVKASDTILLNAQKGIFSRILSWRKSVTFVQKKK